MLGHMRGVGVGLEAACVGLLLLLLGHMRGVGVGFEAAGGPMLLLELLFEYEVHV